MIPTSQKGNVIFPLVKGVRGIFECKNQNCYLNREPCPKEYHWRRSYVDYSVIKGNTRLQWIDEGEYITVFPIGDDPIKSFRGKSKGVDLVGALLKGRRLERHE